MNDWIFDCIVDALNDARASIDFCSHVFTWLVIIGVACESWFLWREHSDSFKSWNFARTHLKVPWPDRPKRRRIFAEVFSVWLVVFGIWGEYFESSRSGKLETVARQVDGLRNTLLQQKAGNAADNAVRAQVAAGAANESLNQVRTKVAGINEALANRTPRSVLLFAASSDLAKELRPFRNQRFSIRICGPWASNREGFQNPTKNEMFDVSMTLMAVLGAPSPESAEWVHAYTKPGWDKCPNVGDSDNTGISIWLSADAPLKTKQAAAALGKVLGSILPPQPRPMVSLVTKDFEPPISDDATAPWAVVAHDPGVLDVIVRRPPMQFIFGQEKKRKSSTK